MADSISTTMTGSSGDSITVDVSTSLVSAVEAASSLDLEGDVNVQGALTDSGVAVTNQNDLDAHTGDTSNPHSVTASQAGAIGGSIVSNSSVQLSGGDAVISTGVTSSSALLNVDLAVDGSSVASDCKVGAVAFWDESAGEHKIEIYEYETGVDDPTVNYRIWKA